MKICATEIMKRVKAIEEEKNTLLDFERNSCTSSYVTDKDKVDAGYDYDTVRAKIDGLDEQVCRLKAALNKINATVKVAGYSFTLGEGLVRLAQLSGKRAYLESLPEVQSSRRVTYNGVIEFTDCLYSVDKVKQDIAAVREAIYKLQMAIDKTNLTHTVEISD